MDIVLYICIKGKGMGRKSTGEFGAVAQVAAALIFEKN